MLVVDNKNSSVVAYCGSADFYDDGSYGQVNGITAVRSPGSTLKAALYAYAFDNGNLTPQMKLADIPIDFNGYQPENYDLKFYGNVSTEFALVNSLNIPAVNFLQVQAQLISSIFWKDVELKRYKSKKINLDFHLFSAAVAQLSMN